MAELIDAALCVDGCGRAESRAKCRAANGAVATVRDALRSAGISYGSPWDGAAELTYVLLIVLL